MLNLEDSTDLCRLLGDSTRLRLLGILAEEELTVAELTEVTRLSQSRVSTHLGKLREAKLVRDRRSGTSSYYSVNWAGMSEDSRKLVELLRTTMIDPLLEEDMARVSAVIRVREKGNWADSVAGRMHRHYSPGRTWEAASRGMLGFAKLGKVLDLASGDGVLSELIAQRADSITCVDLSPKVVEAGRKRLGHLKNVSFVEGDMHDLPFPDNSFDQVTLMNALTYTETPSQVIGECARVLRRGGRLVGSTLAEHRHEDLVAQYNHISYGFKPQDLRGMFEQNGFVVECCEQTCREKQQPYFEIITIHAHRPQEGAQL